MPLHTVDSKSRETIAPATYAADLSERALPKRRMPDNSIPADVAYALVRDELILDGNSRQNLATFCTTWVEPQVRRRAFLEGIGVDLFVTTLGLTVAPALVTALSQG